MPATTSCSCSGPWPSAPSGWPWPPRSRWSCGASLRLGALASHPAVELEPPVVQPGHALLIAARHGLARHQPDPEAELPPDRQLAVDLAREGGQEIGRA